ncbi:MAG: hydrolase, alpha/beta fold family protein, partial [Frankiales bacterium]|nr:hydrolase, alpha/beta fold family protein [Frankiales bacterium]
PLLEDLGHTVLTPEFPVDDDSAGLEEYVQIVLAAVEGHSDLVLVAQSMGGLTAPLVAARVPVRLLVMLAAMVPAPGETPGEWWANTGQEQARRACDLAEGRDPDAPLDPAVTFLHDLPDAVLAEALARGARGQSGTPFQQPWPFSSWPDVPTRFLACASDRFFPLEFQQRQVRSRLGFEPDVMPGGHLPALAHPEELVRRLEAYRSGVPQLP